MAQAQEIIIPSPPDQLEAYEDRIRYIQDRIYEISVNPEITDPGALANHRKSLDQQKRFLINLFMFFGNIGRAKRATGIGSSSTAYDKWMKQPHFKELRTEILEGFIDMAEEQLNRHIHLGSLDAAKFMLKTKGRDRGYGNKIELVNNNEDFSQRMIKAKDRIKQNKLKEITDGA